MIVPENKRASTVVYAGLGWSLALALGVPLITYVVAHVGWREILGGIGVIALLVSLLIALSPPKGLRGSPVELRTWIGLGRNRLVLLLLTVTLQVSGQFCVYPNLGPLLSRLTQASPEMIGTAFGIFGLCGLFGNMLAVRIVDVIGPFQTSAMSLAALLSGSLAWIIGVGITAPLVLLLASVLWGFGFIPVISMQQTRLVGAAPDFASASVALNTSLVYVGQAIGSGLGGSLPTIACM